MYNNQDQLLHRSSHSSKNGNGNVQASPTYGSYANPAASTYASPAAASSYYNYAPTPPAAASPYSSTPANGQPQFDADDAKKLKDPPLSPAAAAAVNGKQDTTTHDRPDHAFNKATALFWIPCAVLLVFSENETNQRVWIDTFLVSSLVIYALDLANLQTLARSAVWVAVVAQIVLGFVFAPPSQQSPGSFFLPPTLLVIPRIGFCIATACWVSWQWHASQQHALALWGLLPPLTAALVAGTSITSVSTIAVAPYLYMAIMAAAHRACAYAGWKSNNLSRLYTALLLNIPGLLQMILHWGHISSTDQHIWDLVLTFSTPWLLLPQQQKTKYTSFAFLSWSLRVAIVAVAVQQRYLVPFFQRNAYRIAGTHVSWTELTCYWTLALWAGSIGLWLWTQNSSPHAINTAKGSPPTINYFGDYQDDIIQLCLAIAGVGIGKGMGLSWSMTPLPVLGLLGLSLWITTRMLRYLAIFLFVVHATAVVVLTYRFVGLEDSMRIPIAVMRIPLSLTHFGLVVTTVSMLWMGAIMGLAVRSSGGVFNSTLRRFDVVGTMMVIYVGALMVLEITLLQQKRSSKEISDGMDELLEEGRIDESLYHPNLVFLTSAVLVALALFMKNARILKPWSAALAVALALGKAVGVFCHAFGHKPSSYGMGRRVFARSIISAMLCAVLFTPGAFLKPIYVKRSRRGPDIPPQATRTIMLYCFVMVPVSILASTPKVILPLVKTLMHCYHKHLYYSASNPVVEFLGIAVSLWGLSCLTMLSQYLPDGGGEAWKKLSGLAFLIGIGLLAIAPSMGLGSTDNPYASISSLGMQLVQRSKSRTGGWGILTAALATLLAVSGPLQLKERRTGRKDRFQLFRTMVFSLLFGGGIAWFITLQNMNQTGWLALSITLMATLTLAFIGTVAAVLGYFVELENMDETSQIATTWILAFIGLLPIAGLPQFLPSSKEHAFGVGGWLSTYLAVAGLFATAFSLAMNRRTSKNATTRGMGNLGCVTGWLCFIVVAFGRYGVGDLESFDAMPTGLVKLPAAVALTFSAAPLLFLLEGEKMAGRSRRSTVPTSLRPSTGSGVGLTLPHLSHDTRWFPPFLGVVMVFLLASIYAVLIRGIFPPSVGKHVLGGGGYAVPSTKAYDKAMIQHLVAQISLVGLESSEYTTVDMASFWISPVKFYPMFHLVGIILLLPCLFRLTKRYLWNRPSDISVASIVLAGSPLLFCLYLPCLQMAALLTCACGASKHMEERKIERDTRMRI